jgi:hypothetical protein
MTYNGEMLNKKVNFIYGQSGETVNRPGRIDPIKCR